MVAHIKSLRLVAFLIYSSLSIYASHGKKEYIIQMSLMRGREINLISKLLLLPAVVVAWEDFFFAEQEEKRKNHAFGFHAVLKKNVFCVVVRGTLFIELSLFEIFVYTHRFFCAFMKFDSLFRKLTKTFKKERKTCFSLTRKIVFFYLSSS